MFFIILIGLLLRITFINKIEGLWNDEYVSWMVASTPFNQGFWGEVLKQCHMPLYYLYLKPFAGFNDFVLRLTSLVPSVISIYVMYLVGKQYSKKTGILAASITSVLSFLVYYAQEVRFYSLLFMFSAILLYFTIRLLKEHNKSNILGFVTASLLVVLTHVLGIIFVSINALYVFYKKKTLSKSIIIGGIILLICLSPLFINILNQMPSSQWWGRFSYTNVLFLFSDYFSPVLTNKVNVPPVFFYNIRLAFWMLIPTVVGLIGLSFGIKNNRGITVVSCGYLLVLFTLAILGKLVFITKYSIEILPILILLVSTGFARLNRIGLVLFSIFISFHLASFFTPFYVTKTIRSEGHRIVGEILNSRNPQNIIYTYYAPDRFSRYYQGNAKQLYISKINRMDYVDNPVRILDNIPNGETFSIVFLDSVSFLPENYIENPNVVNSEMLKTFSHIRNILTKEVKSYDKDIVIDRIGSWIVITLTK